MTDIVMNKFPVKIDGVSQELFVQEGPFKPEGILEHKYEPLQWAIIKEVGNDLIYSTDYWSIEKYWRIFLPKKVYDRLLSRFLQSREVVLDYTNPKKPKVFLPRDQKIDGFTTMYRGVVEDLKSMNGEQLQQHLSELGYDPIWGAADLYLGR